MVLGREELQKKLVCVISYLLFQRHPLTHEAQHIQQEVHWWYLGLPVRKTQKLIIYITLLSNLLFLFAGSFPHLLFLLLNRWNSWVEPFVYLGDISCSSKTKRNGANGFGHEPDWDLITTVPHCLDGLADVPVVMCHANMLWTKKMYE